MGCSVLITGRRQLHADKRDRKRGRDSDQVLPLQNLLRKQPTHNATSSDNSYKLNLFKHIDRYNHFPPSLPLPCSVSWAWTLTSPGLSFLSYKMMGSEQQVSKEL